MFDLDPGKLIVICIVALIAIPSKDLPRVLRTLGQVTGRMRRMAAEFQGQFMEAMREAEFVDLKKEIEETNKSIMASTKLDGAFDPLTEARKQIVSAIEGEPSSQLSEPHPEEASQVEPARLESTKMSISGKPEIDGGVSKDGQPATGDGPFETRPWAAPQGEDAGDGQIKQKTDK